MPIGFSSVSTLPVPASYRRDGLAERQQRNSEQAAASQQPEQQAAREVTRTRATAATQNADNQQPQFADKLPAQARYAVAAYSSNGPTIEERLGVELAGVDVYA